MHESLEQVQAALDLPMRPREKDCLVPLKAAHLAIWSHVEKFMEPRLRMGITAVRILGNLDARALECSVEFVVGRHESLRTRIVATDGPPRQVIDADCRGHFQLTDLSKTPRTVVEDHARRVAQDFLEEPVDVSLGPLFAAKLIRLSQREHVLILALEHMISDYESNQILARELLTAYSHTAQRRPVRLPELSVQFADYAVWQSQACGALRRLHGAYWKQRLSGMPQFKLPAPNGVPNVAPPVGQVLQVSFGERLSVQLREIAGRRQTFMSLAVLTVYSAVMSRWCDQRDLHIVFVSNGRSRPELIDMIGSLAFHLHLRIQIGPEDNFFDILERVSREFLDATRHQDFWLVPDFVLDTRTDLYFNWVSHPPAAANDVAKKQGGNVSITPYPCYRKAVPAVLASFFLESPGDVVWSVEYRPDVLATSTIEWLGRNMRSFAEEMVNRPLTRVASLSMSA